uniref:Uncharacterized protein n=1 Tax=Manihot esculenta TaxID=3983 RepID=A0A2C9VJ73_MANES
MMQCYWGQRMLRFVGPAILESTDAATTDGRCDAGVDECCNNDIETRECTVFLDLSLFVLCFMGNDVDDERGR